MTAPSATRSHRSPGRLRLRIPGRSKDHAFFRRIEKSLSELPEVFDVETNPMTGSVLVKHSTDAEVIETFGREQDLFDVTSGRSVTAPRQLQARVEKVVRREEKRGWPRTGIAGVVALVGAAIYQIGKGHLLPPAVTLLESAFRASLSMIRRR